MTAELLEAVQAAARAAGSVALAAFRSPLVVEAKDDGSPVTPADRAAELAARDWITRRFPSDGVLGEELGAVRPGAVRRWLIDPIDGTRTFIRGVPLWGSLVAVSERGEIVAGAAFFPALGEMVAAARGAGCWHDGVRCSVSAVSSIAHAVVVTTDERFGRDAARRRAWRRLAARAALARSWGDCYGYLLVATGRSEVMADGLVSAWDAAPFLPIIEEAGGVFTDWRGERTAFGSGVIATNLALAPAARAILRVPTTGTAEAHHV